MGLSIRIRCRYGFAFSAHFGTTLSWIEGGACGRADEAGVSSSEVNPGGGVGGCESDELKRIDARGVASSRLLEHMLVALRGALARNTHLWVPLPSIGSMLDAMMMSSAGGQVDVEVLKSRRRVQLAIRLCLTKVNCRIRKCVLVSRASHHPATAPSLTRSSHLPHRHHPPTLLIIHPPLYHRPARTTDREALG